MTVTWRESFVLGDLTALTEKSIYDYLTRYVTLLSYYMILVRADRNHSRVLRAYDTFVSSQLLTLIMKGLSDNAWNAFSAGTIRRNPRWQNSGGAESCPRYFTQHISIDWTSCTPQNYKSHSFLVTFIADPRNQPLLIHCKRGKVWSVSDFQFAAALPGKQLCGPDPELTAECLDTCSTELAAWSGAWGSCRSGACPPSSTSTTASPLRKRGSLTRDSWSCSTSQPWSTWHPRIVNQGARSLGRPWSPTPSLVHLPAYVPAATEPTDSAVNNFGTP